MGEYLSSVMNGFLDTVHNVLIYDAVLVSFIVWNIIYELIEWGNSSENTRRKTALQYEKEINCITCKDKDLSSHHNQLMDINGHLDINVQTNVASYSAAMTGSLEECVRGNLPKLLTEDTTTSKATELNVKIEEMSSSKHFETMSPTYMLIVDDDGDPKTYEKKITDEQKLLILKQYKVLKQSPPPIATDYNSWEVQESGKHMPGLDHQPQPTSAIKWPVKNFSNLRRHFLRKTLENLMMSFPKIVQRSMEIYNESCKIPLKQKCFSIYTEPSLDSNGPKPTPNLKSDITVPNVTPIFLNLGYKSSMVNDHIQSFKKTIETMGNSSDNSTGTVPLPIGYKKNYKKLASSMTFKSSSRREIDLPMDTILQLRNKMIQNASPKVCIDKSSKKMKNSTRQNHFLEPAIIEVPAVTRSKLQTTKTKNMTEVIEEHESNGTTNPKSQRPPYVTSHVYSNPLQESHVFSYSLVHDQNVPTTIVREVTHSCSDRQAPRLLLQSTNPNKTSTLKLLEVFTSFKRFLLKTMEPSYPQRRLRTDRATRKELF